MNEKATLEQVVELEQYFIDTLKPNLNVDLVASSSGYHDPMSAEARERLRKHRGGGIPIYIYIYIYIRLMILLYYMCLIQNSICMIQ
jgi:hypothetical protein